MKIHQKIPNLILTLAIIFSTLVFTGVESFAIDSQTLSQIPSAQPPAVQAPAVQTLSGKQVEQNAEKPSTIPEKNAYAMEHMPKTGFKYAFFKFLITMLGVLVSSAAIFVGLKFYKKIVLQNNAKSANVDYDKTLESPKDFKEAINLFLNKTKE